MSAPTREEYAGVVLSWWERGGSVSVYLKWPSGMWERITWPKTNAANGHAAIAWMLRHGAVLKEKGAAT